MWPGWSRSKTPFVKTTLRPSRRSSSATRWISLLATIVTTSGRLLERDPGRERPMMLRPVDADVGRPRLHAERVEQPVIVVRIPVARVDGDIQLIRAFDQLEAVDFEGDFDLALPQQRVHMFDIGVRPLAVTN